MLAVSACGTTQRAETAAFCVRDAPVTQGSLAHWSSVFAAMSTAALRGVPPRRRAEQFLIAAARTVGEARELKANVTTGEADTTLERLRYEPGQEALKAALRSRSETQADRREIVKLSMLTERLEGRLLRQAELAIPTSVLTNYYDRHKHDFVIPERRDVAIVVNYSKREVELALKEIRSGKSLIDVIHKRNDEPVVGGIHRNLRRGHTPRLYEERFFATKPKVLVGPLKVVIYYLYEVLAIKPSKQRDLTEVEAVIRHRLVSAAAHRLVAASIHQLEARWPLRPHCGAKSS
jgi:hypothetical protein